MARSVPESARAHRPPSASRLVQGAALAVAWLVGTVAPTAEAPGVGFTGDIRIEDGYGLLFDPDGSWSLRDVTLSHGRDTRIIASSARGVEKTGGLRELTLTGKVHIEFRNAILDCDSAFVVLRGEQLVSVDVKGSQATFSHQPAQAPRRINGRANEVRYAGDSGTVTFTGDTFFDDGRIEAGTNLVRYNINTGQVSDDGDPETRVRGVFRAGEPGRLAPPRTPERETAE